MQKYQFPINPPYRISQKYGENALNYDKLGIPGLLKHNGVDVAVPMATPILVPFDGRITAFENKVEANDHRRGYGNYLRFLAVDEGQYFDWIFGHMLPGFKAKIGMNIYKNELLALVDNTGFSTGSHVHFGVRKLGPGQSGVGRNYLGDAYTILDYDNGALGYIDPLPFFDEVIDETYPVDLLYMQGRSWIREKSWQIVHESYAKKRAKKLALSWSDRFMKAFVYGYWDAKTVFDPAMIPLWRTMTKPEYLKRLGRL